MKKTDIYSGIASYIMKLNKEAEPLTKEENEMIFESMKTALLMLNSIHEPIDPFILENALANLLAYIVSNGKGTHADKINHLSSIVLKTKLVLVMTEQTPVAEVLDTIHGKKYHPIIRIFK